eukprot:TRINITY_DN2667_c0_g1_i1.p1 TRINITY_DN2667_c0_g1~~TRINITY_DN2667_c0_g1_i1.p1  ORF type:complete len:479 (+),score=144.27 TRINITY_DN2667_c0_g1_i1:27-1463(+)
MSFSFSRSFWNGFPRVVQRSEIGVECAERFLAFITSRIEAEEIFLKALQKSFSGGGRLLGKRNAELEKLIEIEEYNTARVAWKTLNATGSKEMDTHRATGQKLSEIAQKTKEFLKDQKLIRKQAIAEGQKLLDDWGSREASAKKAKEKYHESVQKLTGLEVAKDVVIQQNRSNATQEIAKLNVKLSKQEKEVSDLNEEYKTIITSTQSYHPEFVESMKTVMRKLQKAEEDRISFLKRQSLDYSIALKSQIPDLKAISTGINASSIAVDKKKDILEWSEKNKADTEPPSPPVYIFKGSSHQPEEPAAQPAPKKTATVELKVQKSSSPSTHKRQTSMIPLGTSEKFSETKKEEKSFIKLAIPTNPSPSKGASATSPRPLPPIIPKPVGKTISSESSSSSEEQFVDEENDEGKIVQALHDFIGEESDELDLLEGNTFLVLYKPSENVSKGWWVGQNYGRIGWFPSAFVKEIDVNELEMEQD